MKAMIITLSLSVLLAACVQVPKPLQGEFSQITPQNYAAKPQPDLAVRWTGVVIDVENKNQASCLTVIGKVANEMGRPSYRYRMDTGRFIACKPQFLDPEQFKGKAITITGTAKTVVEKKVGEHNYRYPLVDSKVIYVW